MHKIFNFLVFLLLLPTLSQGQQKEEVFEFFIRKYSKDFAFQEARTVFPLTVYYRDDVPGKQLQDEVPKAKWTPERILDTSNRKIVITMVKRKDGTRGVRRAVADTGAQVLYVFRAMKGKWFLVKVVDEST